MAIISRIGRRSLKVRLLIWSIYGALVAGSITMLYPFALMVAGSSKSAVDTPDAHVIPPFLAGERALYQKHIEGLFNESFEQMQIAYDTDATSFLTLEPPAEPGARFVAAWREFLGETEPPFYAYSVGYMQAPVSRGVLPHRLRAFKSELMREFGGDIDRLNRETGMEFVNWNAFHVRPAKYFLRREKPGENPFHLALREFKWSEPLENRCYFSVEGFFKSSFLKTQYTKDIAAYNEAHGTSYASWDEVRLDRRLPTGVGRERTDEERADWESFVRTILNLLWIRADADAVHGYREFLRAKYRDVAALNLSYATAYGSFDEVPLLDDPLQSGPAFSPEGTGRAWRAPAEPDASGPAFRRAPVEPDASGPALSDWDLFLQGWRDPNTEETHVLPVSQVRIHCVDFQFQDHLKARHGSLEEANASLGTSFKDWRDVLPPQRDMHYLAFRQKKGSLRWEFVKRNYVTVVDFIVLHGRGVLNTVIYCVLAIAAALIVNPLAAYALSRYKPPSAYKILLFLMLTMAFPPMVTQIPAFLMLRELRLLNTFWALILPGVANGYFIFLLKGFFDSLPRELYESAELDGAGEFRIFWQITMSLSKPILAVIALNAFTAAYSNFMMALLICQDEKMWTLMPWLYQLQQRSGQGVVFASLLVAAIPTLVIFAVCQNVIMRGIVVPVEK